MLDIESLRARKFGVYVHNYTTRDVILYALGLGCTTENDLRYLYEHHPQGMAVLPTFGIVAAHPSIYGVPLKEYIPDFDISRTLHGEQYLQLVGPIPTSGRLITRPQLLDIQDKGKGKGTVIVVRTVTSDEATGREVAINEFVSFALGTGGFGSPWPPAPRPAAATASNNPPDRAPDATATERVSPDQAALYRLSGDYNPLHIDAAASRRAGFERPILHGLCTLGISAKIVLQSLLGWNVDFGTAVHSIKARFSKHVFPGETLLVEMWRVSPTKIIFRTKVVERNVVAITNAAIELTSSAASTQSSKL